MTAKLLLRIIPNATKTQIVGWYGEQLKVRVKAPPEKGKANKEIVAYIAKLLNLSVNDLNIITGQTSQNKCLEVNGLSQKQLLKKIETHLY